MDKKVLVAYASKYGATAEIAEKIGQALKQEGLQADVLPVKKLKSLTDYQAFIIGSAVYIAMWRKEATNFLKKNANLLVGKPVWLFSTGPAGEGDPVELLKGWKYPNGLKGVIESIKPSDTAVFSGNMDVKKMNFIEKWMIKNVKSPVGDFRDWEAINKWAKGIAAAVKG